MLKKCARASDLACKVMRIRAFPVGFWRVLTAAKRRRRTAVNSRRRKKCPLNRATRRRGGRVDQIGLKSIMQRCRAINVGTSSTGRQIPAWLSRTRKCLEALSSGVVLIASCPALAAGSRQVRDGSGCDAARLIYTLKHLPIGLVNIAPRYERCWGIGLYGGAAHGGDYRPRRRLSPGGQPSLDRRRTRCRLR